MALGWKKDYFRYKGFFLNVYETYKRRSDLKVFLELVLTLSTLTLFSIFALRPTLLAISQLVKDIQTKEEVVAKMDQKIQNLKTAQNILNQQSSKIELIKSAIPEKPDAELLSEQVQGLANQYGVEISRLSVDEVTIAGAESKKSKKDDSTTFASDAKALVFRITAKGEYSSLNGFIKDITSTRRPFRVDNLSITSAYREEQQTITLVVESRTPYLNPTLEENKQ